MRKAPQVSAIQLDGEQVPVRLKLVRQANLLSRVAGKVAGEHDALQVSRELGVVGEAAMGVEDLAQSAAVRPHLHIASHSLVQLAQSSLRDGQRAGPCFPIHSIMQD